MQIFEFELIDPTVAAPEAAIAPILAFARAAGRKHLLEPEGPAPVLDDSGWYEGAVQGILEGAAVGA